MKKAMFIDAVGMLDTDLVEEYVSMDQRLSARSETRPRRYLSALLVIAASVVLAVVLLVVSVPMIYNANPEAFNQKIVTVLDELLLSDDTDRPEQESKGLLEQIVTLPITQDVLEAMGLGEQEQQKITDRLSQYSLDELRAKLRAYYLLHREKLTRESYAEQDSEVTEQDQNETLPETPTEQPPETETAPIDVPDNLLIFEQSRMGDAYILIGLQELHNQTLSVPEAYLSIPVTEIAQRAFFEKRGIQYVTIPGSVQRIGEQAFAGCEDLLEAELAQGVVSIGIYAFESCRALETVTLPVSLASIGDGAFAECSALKSIRFNGTKSQWEQIVIGDHAIPDGVIIICTDGGIAHKN